MMSEKQRKEMEESFRAGINDGQIQGVTDTQEVEGHKVGDVVMLLNGFGVEVGPFKILGFDKDGKMYLDWDCFWYPVPVGRIIATVEEGGQQCSR